MSAKFAIIFIITLGLLFKVSAPALAASKDVADAVLTVTAGDEKFSLSKTLLKEWRGKFLFTQLSSLSQKPKSLDSYIAGYVGAPHNSERIYDSYSYDPAKVYAWITLIARHLDTSPTEPELTIVNDKAIYFTPPEAGHTVDTYRSSLAVLDALEKNNLETKLITEETKPTRTLAQTNNLGINELLAEGVSSFAGSPQNRIFNIEVGISKLKGAIFKHGEEVSFNQNICPVEKSTGYLPELVIRADVGTVPEYGGGLCQVSSTLFRAVMNSGMQVSQRKNHSYAVQYYAPQGSDATTYCGGIDFKFINDTPGNILIWPYFKDKNTLVFSIYGTKDSRKITVEKPLQYDKKADGSMKATWKRTVITNGGQTREDVFKSVYLPPALFHKQEEITPPAASARSAGAEIGHEQSTKTSTSKATSP